MPSCVSFFHHLFWEAEDMPSCGMAHSEIAQLSQVQISCLIKMFKTKLILEKIFAHSPCSIPGLLSVSIFSPCSWFWYLPQSNGQLYTGIIQGTYSTLEAQTFLSGFPSIMILIRISWHSLLGTKLSMLYVIWEGS